MKGAVLHLLNTFFLTSKVLFVYDSKFILFVMVVFGLTKNQGFSSLQKKLPYTPSVFLANSVKNSSSPGLLSTW